MPLGLNNPLPTSLRSECQKTGKILTSFIDPRQAFGADKIIPPNILSNAKGLAILTVFKAGFLGSVRFGSGVVVARLADGSWSAPAAIGIGGAGFGGQLGFELTDFVFILNDANAVKTFAQVGSITLGGNVSVAAGPVGRNAEAAGAASLKSVSGVFAYSKTKGLFAGVSLEGSAIIERQDANSKLYNRRVSAKQLLDGSTPVPGAAEPLMRVLNSRVFSRGGTNTDMYNDIPIYDDQYDEDAWQGRRGSAYGEGQRPNRSNTFGSVGDDYEYRDRPQRSSTFSDHNFNARANPGETFDSYENRRSRGATIGTTDDFGREKPKPARPSAPKPVFNRPQPTGPNQAIAKFTFQGEQDGDLSFKKGEIITIIKRTDNETDWWEGSIDGRKGIFPSNYVDTV